MLNILIVLLLIAILLYAFVRHQYTYWDRQNFPFLKPVKIPFGNLRAFAKREKSFGIAVSDLYNETTRKYIGIYTFWRPALLIRDAELVKRVLITDCEYFFDRGVYVNEERDEMSGNLFSLRGQSWRHLRQKLSPLFSTGKLKVMLPTFLNEVEVLSQHIEQKVEAGEIVELKSTFLLYALNIIASLFFGIDANCIKDPNTEFRQIHTKIASRAFIDNLRTAILFLAPNLIDLLRINRQQPAVQEYFLRITKETIRYREENNVRRNDFMQLLIDLAKDEEKIGEKPLSVEKIAGNVFIFYIAGTETTSATAGYGLYEMAKEPSIQKKVQDEIDQTLARYGGEITYDAIGEMKYLDMVVKEILRKYPGLPILQRECTKDYQIPDTNQVIKKGTSILISVLGLHSDPKYFDEPEKFIPERFEKGSETYDANAYIPFGEGPHQCIAVRMGLLVAKSALVKLLSLYDFSLTSNEPLEFDNYAVALIPKGGINLRITKRHG